jgi:hypothetical protein
MFLEYNTVPVAASIKTALSAATEGSAALTNASLFTCIMSKKIRKKIIEYFFIKLSS